MSKDICVPNMRETVHLTALFSNNETNYVINNCKSLLNVKTCLQMTNLPSWHCIDKQESSDGSITHGPWCKKESNAMPNQGITSHRLTPFFFYELKTVANDKLKTLDL